MGEKGKRGLPFCVGEGELFFERKARKEIKQCAERVASAPLCKGIKQCAKHVAWLRRERV